MRKRREKPRAGVFLLNDYELVHTAQIALAEENLV